jgi:hypothetical protein
MFANSSGGDTIILAGYMLTSRFLLEEGYGFVHTHH